MLRNPIRCERRSALDRFMVITIFAVIFTCYYTYGIAVPLPANQEKICQSEECKNTALRIQRNMDDTVKPCDNFYKFACGGFLKSTTVPNDRTTVNTISVINDLLENQIREIVEKSSGQNNFGPFDLVNKIYKSCTNTMEIEKQGLKPLKELLRGQGGWPVVDGDSWNETALKWKDYEYFVPVSVVSDLKNSTQRVLRIGGVGLGLPIAFLMNGTDNEMVEAYYNYMVDMAVILGADKARAEKELNETLQFEIELAEIAAPLVNLRDPYEQYNPMTVRELSQKFKSIPWKNYLNELLAPNARVDEDERVIIVLPSYIANLENLLERTPKRVKANKAMWTVVHRVAVFMNEAIRKRQLQYFTIRYGVEEWEPRWKECIELVTKFLPISVDAMYVRKYFQRDTKKYAEEMVTEIRREVKKILEKAEWMDEITRNSSLEKAASMVSYIAYPSELMNDTKIEQLYDGLELSQNNFLGDVRNLLQFTVDCTYAELRKPVNKSDWVTHSYAAMVNAFYFPNENSIGLPAGILQGFFFNKDRPQYTNYGSIGYVIGHEITHGFDDKGRKFDKDGNLVDWWTPETANKFLKKAECIIRQYGNYTEEEINLKLNSKNTQGENIADNGGIKVAYYAYREWEKKNGPEPLLPGLDFNAKQLFWISAANVWCSKSRPEFMKDRIENGVHSPPEFRVVGPFSNMPEFAQDFNCPLNSKMNPEKKCYIM